MRELQVQIIKGEVWLKCDDHGLLACFGTYANLADLIVAENEHATIHLINAQQVS
jgi:hypothetical protein